MPKLRMTDMSVRALKPPTAGQVTYWSQDLPAFGLRVSMGGTKSWVVMTGRDRRLITLSRYPATSLKDARRAALTVLGDPPPQSAKPVLFDEALATFLTASENRNRPRTTGEYRRLLTKHFRFAGRALSSITTDEILTIIDGMSQTKTEQLHVFLVGRTFFRFCMERKYLTHSPYEGLRAPGRFVTRERVLTDKELASVWLAAIQEPFPFGHIIRLCILTGQRRGEIAQLRWQDFDGQTCTIPAHVAKNGKAHTFPYGKMVRDILEDIPRTTDYLFPGRAFRETPRKITQRPRPSDAYFRGWSRAKQNFDKRCPIPHWQLHDLRRTFSTNLAALGVSQIVVEKLLNHVSGSQSPIARVYNRHQYATEMRQAIEAWELHLQKLT